MDHDLEHEDQVDVEKLRGGAARINAHRLHRPETESSNLSPVTNPTYIIKDVLGKEAVCPECGSDRVWKAGLRSTTQGPVQRRICRDCAYRFSETRRTVQDNADFERKLDTPLSFFVGSEHSERLQKLQSLILKSGADKPVFCQVGAAQTPGAKNLAEVETRTQEKAAGATTILNAKTEFAERLKRDGYSQDTINQCVHYLRLFEKKGVNILQPEQVKSFIADQKWQNHSKATAATLYGLFAKTMHLQWNPPRYKYDQKIPFIPTEKEMDDLIAGTGRKTSTFLRTLKETGCRMGEALRLRWQDIDFAKNTVAINNPEKNSLPRILRVSPTLMTMLNTLPRESELVFNRNRNTVECNYRWQRNKLAIKLGNPRLKQISLRTFRHFYATMLYAHTLNILKVQQALGHKSVKNTEIYTHLLSDNFSLEYDAATAETDAERKALIKAGYEFVERDKDISYYRKPKYL